MAQAKTSRSTRSSDGPSVLGASVQVRGRVTGDGDLTIEGSIDGTVVVSGELVIASGASVSSDEPLTARSAQIAGTVTGGVIAQGPVRLSSTAHVRGDLKGSEISIDEGAEFEGRIDAAFDLPAELAGGGRR
jgi:cytoskeletal protein CcmA (bactofilin family)